ncbi:Unknown protein sequence [Pseudomonas syringae pv. cilantro]|uniref:Uncharacterized protein n=1 Tax=Pseudomonas syringae pv. cilantro TaxID=81035 RepID=A0A0N1JNJ9_PSESX|nr:Unknown protein sequence [Pseudomonas syringae pv. cilantro]
MLAGLLAEEWWQSAPSFQLGLFFGAKCDVQSAHGKLSKAGMTFEV